MTDPNYPAGVTHGDIDRSAGTEEEEYHSTSDEPGDND